MVPNLNIFWPEWYQAFVFVDHLQLRWREQLCCCHRLEFLLSSQILRKRNINDILFKKTLFPIENATNHLSYVLWDFPNWRVASNWNSLTSPDLLSNQKCTEMIWFDRRIRTPEKSNWNIAILQCGSLKSSTPSLLRFVEIWE